MEQWRQDRLIDILDTLIDYRGKTPNKVDCGIPLITAKIVKNGRIDIPTEFLPIEDYSDWMVRGFPQVGDVVLTTEAPLGEVAQLKDEKIALAQRIVCLRGKEGVLDNTYLKYFFLSNIGQNRLKARETGTTVTGIKQSELKEILIDYPKIDTQKSIASILSSLDNKIELNRRINDNLEQQAQALFKSWFVDFEPFKDGKFVESEMGMIPTGWKVGKLEDIAEVVGGGTPSKANALYFDKQCIPWITPKDLSIKKTKFISKGEIDITEEGYMNSSAKKIPKGSVLFSSRAPIGYISIAENELTTNQGFKSVVPVKAGTCFLYLYLKENTKAIEAQATGSTFKEASGSLMKSLCVVIPPDSVFDYFEKTAFPFFSTQANVEREISILSKTRDFLLPRLMSGELKINDLNC